jgi:hypothetical protein
MPHIRTMMPSAAAEPERWLPVGAPKSPARPLKARAEVEAGPASRPGQSGGLTRSPGPAHCASATGTPRPDRVPDGARAQDRSHADSDFGTGTDSDHDSVFRVLSDQRPE